MPSPGRSPLPSRLPLCSLPTAPALQDHLLAAQRTPIVMQTRYEQLCAEPLATLRTATEFAGLEWRRAIERVPLRSQNDKLQQALGPDQQAASQPASGRASRAGVTQSETGST
jgi:hypothetical protein